MVESGPKMATELFSTVESRTCCKCLSKRNLSLINFDVSLIKSLDFLTMKTFSVVSLYLMANQCNNINATGSIYYQLSCIQIFNGRIERTPDISMSG